MTTYTNRYVAGSPNRNLPATSGGAAQSDIANRQLPKMGNEMNNLYIWLGFLLLGISMFILNKVNKAKI